MDREKQIQNDLEIMETIIKEAFEFPQTLTPLFGYLSQEEKADRLEKAERLSRRIEHQLLPELLTPSTPGVPENCDMRFIARTISKSVLDEAQSIYKDGINLGSMANIYTHRRLLSMTHYSNNVKPKLLEELEQILSSSDRNQGRKIENEIH